MAANATNLFGLQYLSAVIAYSTNLSGQGPGFTNVNAGSTVTFPQPGWWSYAFPSVAQPELATINYYFAPFKYDAYYLPVVGVGGSPLPGMPEFSPTNRSPTLIAGVGSTYQVAGHAKQIILNGDQKKFGYLGQYFDKAFQIDTNGNITGNHTGILSPFGEFFPTEPGPVALATMPDLDTGQCGTGVVYAIKLALDVNHDGVIDLSFGGPDNTSPGRPFVFWCNNNYDRWDNDSIFHNQEQDDQIVASCPFTNQPTPDCNYRDQFGQRVIPCTRDLEDFARLWVCGVTDNLLLGLDSDASINLSWGDVGNPNPSNPTIDLFVAADADGGIGYLTNSTVAAQQTNQWVCSYVGRVGPGQKVELNTVQFLDVLRSGHLIWCGVSNGTGVLTLTISQGTNTLAQTSAHIQIQDIKRLYERWTVGDDPDTAPKNLAYLAREGDAPGVPPFQYSVPPAVSTPYILLVHGFNLEVWDKDRFAEAAFKRLYWQGYQGRFGQFRWPTTQQHIYNPGAFDKSEINSWSSGVGLLNLLVNLNKWYPTNVYLMAHSHGTVAAGEALRLAGTNQVANTYITMQAALDSHTYDSTTPMMPISFDTPDRYGAYYINGAACYFNGVGGAGNYINFFNPYDMVVGAIWQSDQVLKPDVGYSYHSSDDSWWDVGLILASQLRFPQNTYTIFSYCDQAHGFALGSQNNVGGPFRSGVMYNQIELDLPPYNFGAQHIYHSAEFRSDNPHRWQFWNQVLFQMGLKP